MVTRRLAFTAAFMAAFRRRSRLLTAWLAAYLPRLTERRPSVQVVLGAWLPGWGLRLALGALALSCASLVVRGPAAWVVLIALSAAVVIWPAGVAPAAIVVVLGVVYAARGPSTGSGTEAALLQTALLLLGLHALASWALLIGRASWKTRVELGALVAPLRRFLGVQAFVQPLALLGGWLAGRTPGLAVLPVLAVLGLGLVAYLWLPRLPERPAPTT